MKLDKKFTHSRQRVIWRLLLNENGQLLIEERDIENKKVFFQCYELSSGKQLMKDITFDEPFWIGIEEFKSDIIYFHWYVKPDMPWHSGMFAYSVSRNEILWENKEINFGFMHNEKVAAYRQTFEGADYFLLDEMNGEIIEVVGNDHQLINEWKSEAQTLKDYSQYIFPSNYTPGDEQIDALISPYIVEYKESVEIAEKSNVLFITSHRQNKQSMTDQHIFGIDIYTKKIILQDIINKDQTALRFDSFFIFSDFLIIIKNKVQVIIYSIIN
jgi:hypothetical protein